MEHLIKKGFSPLAFRYLTLTAHYRSKLSFAWENLQAAQNALQKLYTTIANLQSSDIECQRIGNNEECQEKYKKQYKQKFLEYINDDLDMPKAVALMWQMLDDSKLANKEKYVLFLDFDKVFGLEFDKVKPKSKQKIPKQILELTKKREQLRQEKQWQKADKIRKQIENKGYEIEDSEKGPKIKKQ